jgi:hypothetical protein
VSTQRYEIKLTESELRAVYLFSMLRRPGTGLKRFVAIAVGGIALAMAFQRTDAMAHVLGVMVALACGWIALRPFIVARVLSKQGGPEVTVELDETGVLVTRTGKTARFAWSRITAQGRGPGFYWYEIQGAAIAAIPDRLVSDRPGLEALLKRAGQPS